MIIIYSVLNFFFLIPDMLYSCLGIGFFAVLYEGIKTFREWVTVKTADALEKRSIKRYTYIVDHCKMQMIFSC